MAAKGSAAVRVAECAEHLNRNGKKTARIYVDLSPAYFRRLFKFGVVGQHPIINVRVPAE